MGKDQIILYSYWRSSCSWRVRIALNMKNISYEIKPINLLKGEQVSPEYKKINPLGEVPALQIGDKVITQSLAILEYLEETYPDVKLLPKDPVQRALARFDFQMKNLI